MNNGLSANMNETTHLSTLYDSILEHLQHHFEPAASMTTIIKLDT
jgi:hypothetical protein